ncbi:MAG: hypothetical protein Q4A07_11155 [Coriobacteriales bacterium]|nr:hypothetical protein [Coriobacteriales bacterium]
MRKKSDQCACAANAPCVPDSDEGPVYLEGRLVLSLSFRRSASEAWAIANEGDLIERYRLWDDLAEAWYDSDLELLRFDRTDVVVCSRPSTVVLWKGAVDTRARVVPEPDLSEDGVHANQGCDLRWKRA